MHRPILSILLALTIVRTGESVNATEFKGPQDVQYRSCLALVNRKPEDAFEAASAWRDRGGGFPAKHCAALALVALGHHGDAAGRLERLALEMQATGDPLRPEVLGQAGNAWLLANQPERAHGVFTSALAMQPDHVDLLIDRARASAALGRFVEALPDLDRAVGLDPRRADAYAYRASARRQSGDAAGALADAETALKIDPREIEALLERGILRAAKGDRAGARADWMIVVTEAAGTPAGDAAQRNLERLDLRSR
ncbi:MAG: tetratricopeptide repeat protein [Alphaproteobacteria bacterium]|nr:tetratricopeptide repeat protein [Alphaproteobacteria bacterium]